jgi:hypothetical protein
MFCRSPNGGVSRFLNLRARRAKPVTAVGCQNTAMAARMPSRRGGETVAIELLFVPQDGTR